MTELTLAIGTILGRLDLRSFVDILIIAVIIYWVLLLLRGTTAMALLRGILAVFLLGWVLSAALQLTMLGWLLRSALPAMLVVSPILFQPELRRVLERVGRGLRGLSHPGAADNSQEIAATVARACRLLSERRHGALIVLERATGLQDYVDGGVPVDALPSTELLVGLFIPACPLHDGAIILRRGRILAARCTMPLSERVVVAQRRLGMRHKAGLGIAERTDAVAVVVSEETGRMSVAANGRLMTPLDETGLREALVSLLQSQSPLPNWRDAVGLTQPRPAPVALAPNPDERAAAGDLAAEPAAERSAR